MKDWLDFRARLAGMDFRGDRFEYETGAYIDEITGISSGAAITYASIPLAGGPGVHDVAGDREAPRIFSMQGFLYGRSAGELGTLVDQFGGLLVRDADAGWFEWEEYGQGWRRAHVRRDGSPTPKRDGSTGFATFTLTLRAHDQRIYGTPEAAGWASVVSGVNEGAYDAPVILEVRGNSAGGWTVAGPGGTFVAVGAPITPGSIHRYDCDTGLLTIDGVPQVTGVLRSDRLELPPGDFTLAVNNGCEIRAHYASTWAP